eukprot:112575-Chlamydomonas_euryale.AAC.6
MTGECPWPSSPGRPGESARQVSLPGLRPQGGQVSLHGRRVSLPFLPRRLPTGAHSPQGANTKCARRVGAHTYRAPSVQIQPPIQGTRMLMFKPSDHGSRARAFNPP